MSIKKKSPPSHKTCCNSCGKIMIFFLVICALGCGAWFCIENYKKKQFAKDKIEILKNSLADCGIAMEYENINFVDRKELLINNIKLTSHIGKYNFFTSIDSAKVKIVKSQDIKFNLIDIEKCDGDVILIELSQKMKITSNSNTNGEKLDNMSFSFLSNKDFNIKYIDKDHLEVNVENLVCDVQSAGQDSVFQMTTNLDLFHKSSKNNSTAKVIWSILPQNMKPINFLADLKMERTDSSMDGLSQGDRARFEKAQKEIINIENFNISTPEFSIKTKGDISIKRYIPYNYDSNKVNNNYSLQKENGIRGAFEYSHFSIYVKNYENMIKFIVDNIKNVMKNSNEARFSLDQNKEMMNIFEKKLREGILEFAKVVNDNDLKITIETNSDLNMKINGKLIS